MIEQPLADGQPTRSSMLPDSAELRASEDLAELNRELSSIEQHCQLFDDMLNVTKTSETSHSDREVLKVTIFGSLLGWSTPCHFHKSTLGIRQARCIHKAGKFNT